MEISEQAVQVASDECDVIQKDLKGYTLAIKEIQTGHPYRQSEDAAQSGHVVTELSLGVEEKKQLSLKEAKELQALKEELADAQVRASWGAGGVTCWCVAWCHVSLPN